MEIIDSQTEAEEESIGSKLTVTDRVLWLVRQIPRENPQVKAMYNSWEHEFIASMKIHSLRHELSLRQYNALHTVLSMYFGFKKVDEIIDNALDGAVDPYSMDFSDPNDDHDLTHQIEIDSSANEMTEDQVIDWIEKTTSFGVMHWAYNCDDKEYRHYEVSVKCPSHRIQFIGAKSKQSLISQISTFLYRVEKGLEIIQPDKNERYYRLTGGYLIDMRDGEKVPVVRDEPVQNVHSPEFYDDMAKMVNEELAYSDGDNTQAYVPEPGCRSDTEREVWG